MPKQVLFSEAHQSIKSGIDKIANAVKSTLGPRGQNVIIAHPYGGPPIITKDGVTVARHIELEDQLEDIGAALIKEVAAKTVESCGDGTTSSVVLAQAIFHHGLKNIVAGASPVDLKAGIDLAVKAVVESLKAQSKPVESLEQIIQVATISTNGDAVLGELIAKAIHEVGPQGVVMCKSSHKTSTEVTVVKGMQVDRGYSSPYFATDTDKMECEMENAFVLVTDKPIQSMKMLLPILEQLVKVNKALLIIGEVEGEALSTLVLNKTQGRIRVVTVKPPVFWNLDQYQDVAILTGTEVVSDVRGVRVENVKLETLGKAEKITVKADVTIIVAGEGQNDAVDARVERLKNDLLAQDADKELIESRIAKLTGGIAMIHVGGATEVEVKEKRDRVEDAIFATRAAVTEGIIRGGGLAFVYAAEAIDHIKGVNQDQKIGFAIVLEAIKEPFRVIAENSGKNAGVIINQVTAFKGYNAREDRFEDLFAAGIIDPTKVARLALENAASIMGLLLTTKAVVINIKPATDGQAGNK